MGSLSVPPYWGLSDGVVCVTGGVVVVVWVGWDVVVVVAGLAVDAQEIAASASAIRQLATIHNSFLFIVLLLLLCTVCGMPLVKVHRLIESLIESDCRQTIVSVPSTSFLGKTKTGPPIRVSSAIAPAPIIRAFTGGVLPSARALANQASDPGCVSSQDTAP